MFHVEHEDKMENKTGTSECKTAHGRPITSYKDKDGNPLEVFTYEFTYDAYTEDKDGEAELVKDNNQLTLLEQLKVRNAERVSNARAKQLALELTSRGVVKPDAKNDPQVLLKDIFDKLMITKLYDVEGARKMATQVTGIEWAV